MTLKWSCMVALAVFTAVAFAQTEASVNAPGIQKIDMESLLDVPVGSTLLDTGIKRVTQEEGVFQMAVPLEWSEKAKGRDKRGLSRESGETPFPLGGTNDAGCIGFETFLIQNLDKN